MLPIAGQTALPIGLNFFMDSHGLSGGVFSIFFQYFFKIKKNVNGQRRRLLFFIMKQDIHIYVLYNGQNGWT